MIPKIIHYCWFGKGKKTNKIERCVKSWQKYCPDYEIKEWNEDNFDINAIEYTKKAYNLKKWAFVSDVARLYALVNYGGVYLDTDMEILKPIDCFLKYDAFMGWECETILGSAIIGSIKNNSFLNEVLLSYKNMEFKLEEDGLYLTNTIKITMALLKYGLVQDNTLQKIKGFTIFPKEFFYPKDESNGIICIAKQTFTIHHFMSTHIGKWSRFRLKIYHIINRVFGKKVGKAFYKLFGRGRE